jgi:hypothetical protein
MFAFFCHAEKPRAKIVVADKLGVGGKNWKRAVNRLPGSWILESWLMPFGGKFSRW